MPISFKCVHIFSRGAKGCISATLNKFVTSSQTVSNVWFWIAWKHSAWIFFIGYCELSLLPASVCASHLDMAAETIQCSWIDPMWLCHNSFTEIGPITPKPKMPTWVQHWAKKMSSLMECLVVFALQTKLSYLKNQDSNSGKKRPLVVRFKKQLAV